jgi:hypothetical protein
MKRGTPAFRFGKDFIFGKNLSKTHW